MRSFSRTLGLAIVTLASLGASSGSAFAQATGCTGTIEGAIRLVGSQGGPVCSAATTGPHDAAGVDGI